MGEDLARLWALLGVVAQHPLHQPDGLGAGPGHHSLQANLLMLRHREQFSISEPARVWPVVNIRLAKDHGDLLKLIHF